MQDVFNDEVFQERAEPAEPSAENEQQPETESKVEQSEGENPELTGQTPSDAGAPTAPEQGKHVPLAALESERKQRQDWKEKAIRFEEELKAMRQQSQQQQRESAPQLSEAQQIQQQMLNERFNTSEMVARQQYAAAGDLEEMIQLFSEAAQKNPALGMQLQNARHPWEFAYLEGKKLKALQEIGTDPTAYRDKVRAEILAELQAKAGGAAPAQNPAAPAAAEKPGLPQSLAGSRSSAPRGSAAFTGPAPLDSLFEN